MSCSVAAQTQSFSLDNVLTSCLSQGSPNKGREFPLPQNELCSRDQISETGFCCKVFKAQHMEQKKVPVSTRASAIDVASFKQRVRTALQSLFVSHEVNEFINDINPSGTTLSPHEQFILVKLIVSDSLDRSNHDDRKIAADAIIALARDGHVSNAQIGSALLVLYARLNDLILDVPSAVFYLKEFVRKFELVGYIDADTSETLYQQSEIYHDLEKAKDVKKKINELMREFLTSHDLKEFTRQLKELECSEFHHEVIKKAISLAFDMSDRERELVSQLISKLTGKDVKPVEVRKAFQMLLISANDLRSDVPHITHLLSCFIARAIADEVLPPSFLLQQDLGNADIGSQIVKQSSALLKTNPASSRLERVWGLAGEFDSITNLKESISDILEEYFVSADIADAVKSISELNTPYFYHEVIRRGFSVVLDKDQKQFSRLLELFVALHNQKVVSSLQFHHGFERIKSSLPELSIDAPTAQKLYNDLKEAAISKGLLTEEKVQ